MTSGQALSLSFFLFSVFLFLFFFFFTKKRKNEKLGRKFLLASAGIYISGNLLVFIITLFRAQAPVGMILVCHIMVLFIFSSCTFLMAFLSKKLEDTAKESSSKK